MLLLHFDIFPRKLTQRPGPGLFRDDAADVDESVGFRNIGLEIHRAQGRSQRDGWTEAACEGLGP